MKLNIPIEIVFDDVNSVIDELGKLQKYKLCEDDDMTLVDVDDVVDVLTRHVLAREEKESCGTKEGWIPCSERLPENRLYVLVTYKYEYGLIDHGITWYGQVEGKWNTSREVIAWMPLPKPYGGEDK